MRWIALLVVFLGCSFSLYAEGSFTVSYLGRTFGYYRVPDVQQMSGNVCDASAAALPQVRKLLAMLHDHPMPDALVSLGDNFAPELGGRAVQAEGHLVPKDQLAFDYLDSHSWVAYDKASPQLTRSLANGEGVIDFDNVACFFRLAGFDAMVPGKHDFRFGPQRLQELARYLADPAGSGKAVEMLAANLAISTTLASPPAQSQVAPKPENYAYSGKNGSQFVLPGMPLPYMRQFPIQNGVAGKPTSNLYSHAWICRGSLGEHFDPIGCDELESEPNQNTRVRFKLPVSKYALYPAASALQPGVEYHLCASSVSVTALMTADNTMCHASFQFHFPFLQWGKATQSNPPPYVAARNGVVVFGIVDPQLENEIGALDESWLNGNSAFETRLEFLDPHEALSQVLETCQEDPACAGKRRLLLAQMPTQRAQRLATHLTGPDAFDLVISQADASDATGNLSRTDEIDGSQQKALVVTPGTSIVPGEVDALRVGLSTATIRTSSAERTLRNVMRSENVGIERESYNGTVPLWQLIVKAGLVPAPDEKASIDGRAVVQQGILNAMRQFCKADVAFLQDRDLFQPEHYAEEKPSGRELQSLLDRLLWKGDFISCRPASGAAMKQVKATSDQFASGAKNELVEEGESGRSIEVLGMFSDPTKGLIVDGGLVQDGSLYSIATTDYLAQGETGYAAIASTATARRKAILAESSFDEITAIMCRRLAGAMEDGSKNAYCRESLNADAYLDPIDTGPYVMPNGLTAIGKLREWASENWKTQNVLAPVAGNKTEYAVQNRRTFSVRLDRAELGFQNNLHSLSESERQQRFGGVQAPEPTAPERYDWVVDWMVRLTSYGKNLDRFVQADAEYENSAVRQVFASPEAPGGTIETFQSSLPRNSTGIEAGIETRLFPRHQRNITGVRLLTSGRFETEVTSPFAQFQAADGFINETLPRRNALIVKAGIRYDGERSWLELGAQSGPETQVKSLTLAGLTCDPGDLQACVTTTSVLPTVSQLQGLTFNVQSQRRVQSGLFLNGRIHMPLLYKKLDYVIENQGTLFFNRAGDSPADTRYLETMTHSLVIPVVGNLSIAPRVEIFFFQDKIAGWHIHGYQTSVTAQYRFDWHTGLRWRDALRYPSGPPAQ